MIKFIYLGRTTLQHLTNWLSIRWICLTN